MSAPKKLVDGVYVTVESVKLVVPLDTSDTILKVKSSPSTSAPLKVTSTAVSSAVVSVTVLTVGVSLTEETVIVTVPDELLIVPSLAYQV